MTIRWGGPLKKGGRSSKRFKAPLKGFGVDLRQV